MVSHFTKLLVLLCVINQSTIAQDSFEGNISIDVPSNPTSAGLNRSIVYPTSNQYGLTDISIPLLDVSTAGYPIRLQLNYHGSGIKVDDYGGWVGMSWSLSGAGNISRTTRGLPDDVWRLDVTEIFGQINETTEIGWIQSDWNTNHIKAGKLAQSFPYAYLYAAYYNDTQLVNSLYRNDQLRTGKAIAIASGNDGSGFKIDTEADIFNVMLPNGQSFKFLFDEDGIPRIIGELRKVHIDYVMNTSDLLLTFIDGFTITDDMGIKYFFDKVEMTEVTNVIGVRNSNSGAVVDSFTNDLKYPSGWSVSRIVLPTGKIIDYEYESGETEYTIDPPRFRFSCPIGSDGTSNEFSYGGVLRSTIKIETQNLKKILTPVQEVEFRCSQRTDLPQGKRLDRIISKSRMFADSIKNVIDLNYDVLTSKSCPSGTPVYKCLRLFLKKVIIGSNNSVDDQLEYSLNYNTLQLPYKGSNEQDHWGYYNGNGANSLIPRLYVYSGLQETDRYRINIIPGNPAYHLLPGADRSVSSPYIQAGMLSSIILPTGGKQVYTFESNEYFDAAAGTNQNGGGLRIKKISSFSNENFEELSTFYSYVLSESGNSSGQLVYPPQYAKPVTIAFNRNGLPFGSNSYVYWGFVNSNYSEFEKFDLFTLRGPFNNSVLTNTDGFSIQYKRVVETFIDNSRVEKYYYRPKSYLTNASAVLTTQYNAGPAADVCGEVVDYDPTCDCYYVDLNTAYSWGNVVRSGRNIYPFPPLNHYSNLEDDNLTENVASGEITRKDVYDSAGRLLHRTKYRYWIGKVNQNGDKNINCLVYSNQNVFNSRCKASAPHSYATYRHRADYGYKYAGSEEVVYKSN